MELKYNENDIKNIKELTDFLNEEEIPFKQETITIEFENNWKVLEEIFYLNDGDLELRYINSFSHRMDNSKRFGDIQKGMPKGWFGKTSQEYAQKGKRIIWIKDYEMQEAKDIIGTDGKLLKNYRRKWEVLKSYICCATYHIHHRIYARDTEVVEVDAKEARPFLEEFCFYGFRGATKTFMLKMKKDKNGVAKGTPLMLFSIGHNFYGNKNSEKNGVKIEVIRVGTKCNYQIVGGSSKLLKYFLENYPAITIGKGKDAYDVEIDKVVFYVDYDHNDSRSLYTLGYNHIGHDVDGFHNFANNDIDIPQLKVKKGEIFQRKPMIHKTIMEQMALGNILVVGTAGTDVFELNRKEYLANLENNKNKND